MNDYPDDLNKVSIEVDGTQYGGWKSARIDIGIDRVCRGFVLSVTDSFPGNTKFSRLQPGQKVTLKIGTETVCTGYITSTPISYDAKSISIQIQGKSKTVDLVDCCSPWAAVLPKRTANSSAADQWSDVKTEGKNATPEVRSSKSVNTSWHNQTTAQIISDLCAPYGIKVICEIEDFNSKLTNFTVNPGEKVVDSINRLLTKENLVITDNEFGDLVITNPAKTISEFEYLEIGKNILSGSANFDTSKTFSTYAVLGQHKGSDLEFGKLASQDKGIAYEPSVQRYRLLVIKDTGQSSCSIARNRAQFEQNFRKAQVFESTHTVQGWRQSNQKLWRVNTQVKITDPILNLSGIYLIRELSFTIDSSGLKTVITTISPDAYMRTGANQKQSVNKPNENTNSNWQDVK